MSRYNPTRRRLLQHLGVSSALLASGWTPHIIGATPKRKIGVALVGLGRYSTNELAPALQLTQYCELRGIVTGSPEKIPEWQEKYGIPDGNVYSYDTMHELADNPDIDVVYIVTPPGLHMKHSIAGANAGKHVWCEKPMAMDREECQAIIDACEKNRVQLTVGYRLHHEPNTQTVMRWAREQPFGPIQKVEAVAAYTGGENRSADNWRMQRAMGGGAMYDMGVYPLQGARYSTGEEPIAIRAWHEETHPEAFTEVDSTTYFNLRFPSGAVAECMTSFVKPGNRLEVTCEEGWYNLIPMSNYTGVSGEASDGTQLDKHIANQQAAQMDNDARAILEGTEVKVPGIEGLRDIVIVNAAFESARTGEEITLEPI